jgi:hypothetical protein
VKGWREELNDVRVDQSGWTLVESAILLNPTKCNSTLNQK